MGSRPEVEESKLDFADEESTLLEPEHGRGRQRSKTRQARGLLVAFLLLTSVCIGAGIGLGIGLGLKGSSSSSSSGYKHGAVATDAPKCSEVGVDILKMGGSAVDAAIASLLCVGTINLQSTGIGGGGFMVYYNASSKQGQAFDYRETAPGNATTELYNNTPPATTLRGGYKQMHQPLISLQSTCCCSIWYSLVPAMPD